MGVVGHGEGISMSKYILLERGVASTSALAARA